MNVDPVGKVCADRPSSSLTEASALDRRLARYLATCSATAAGTLGLATTTEAAIVGNSTVQPFGINQEVNIDFNGDGQIDFQIDHDRVNLNGTDLDFLQVDKNDASSAANPLPIANTATFPLGVGPANDTSESKYMEAGGVQGSYPAALMAGDVVGPGPGVTFDFQEGDNFIGSGKTIRANRLIDEDATQIDQVLGGLSAGQVLLPINGPNFVGLGGQVRYLGVAMDLNNANAINYGWIGIRIDNESDATGAVVGYGYQTTPGKPIGAGHIPEPSTMVAAAIGACALFGGRFFGRRRNRRDA